MDKFHTKPVDRVAARVASKGVHYDPVICHAQQMRFDSPPPMRDIPDMLPGGPLAHMVGLRHGSLVVVGLLELIPRRGARAHWVVRCDCGDYELRKARFLNTTIQSAKCRKCSHLDRVKWKLANFGARTDV